MPGNTVKDQLKNYELDLKKPNSSLTLVVNPAARASCWDQFRLIAVGGKIIDEWFCACIICKHVFAYGCHKTKKNYGTKNFTEHVKVRALNV